MTRNPQNGRARDAARPRVVVPFRPREGDLLLREAYERYREVAAGDAPDLLSTTELVEARIALTSALLADGWDAPVEVRERLRRDEQLLRVVLAAS